MKKLTLLLMTAAVFACNSESETGTTTTPDSAVLQQDNTVNRDTAPVTSPDTTDNRSDTANRRDSGQR